MEDFFRKDCQRLYKRSVLTASYRCYFLILFIFVGTFAIAQTQPGKPVVNIPTSPEAAILGRFGDVPVGHYTGTANISIPIYSIKLGSIDLPIVLRYHSSGVKVEDQSTWVGLGWDLSPEGGIIQEIRGKADEQEIGDTCGHHYTAFRQRFDPLRYGISYPYMKVHQWGRATAINTCVNDPYAVPNPYPPLSSNYYDSYCIIDKLNRGYGQPDIYHYNFAGYSGKFYKNPETNEIVLIDRNKQIYFEILNATTIKATTLEGAVWIFDVNEKAEGGIQFEYTGKTYKLGKITLLTGQEVNFAYTDHTYHERKFNESAEITLISGYPIYTSYSAINHTKKTLTSITSVDTRIEFNISNREDLNVYVADNLPKLSSIDIVSRSNNKKIRSFNFYYSYFSYSTIGVPVTDTFSLAHADALGKRLRLDSLREIGYTDGEVAVYSKPAYRFSYDMSAVLPLTTSFAKDFWGYYNAAHNTRLLPNLDYFDYFNQPEYKAIGTTQNYPYEGANRYANNSVAGAYMLNKVVYPTGGYTTFEYEANSFSNQFIPDQSSPVYKHYDLSDHSLGGTSSNLFKLSKATTIHFENRIHNGKGNPNGQTPLTYAQMAGCYISFSKIKLINGSPVITLIKKWDLSTVLNADFVANGGKTWSEDLRVEYDADPNPTFNYQVKVHFPDELNNALFLSIAGVTASFHFYDDTGVDTSHSRQVGFRIKSIKSYTDSGALAGDKLYKYYEGKLLNSFRPLSVYEANYLDQTEVVGGNSYEYITFFKKIKVSGNDFGVSGGNLIGYGRVEEIERNNMQEDNGKKQFTFFNNPNKTGQDMPYTPDLKNGFLSTETVFDAQGMKLLEKTNNYGYSAQQPATPRFVCINTVKLSTGPKIPCGNIYNAGIPGVTYFYSADYYIGSEYGFNAYTIQSEWYNLISTTTKQYVDGITMSSEEYYTYNSEGNIRSIKTIDSRNDTLETRYFYPNDNLSNPVADNHMTIVHNTGTPIITERYKSGVRLSRQRIWYDVYPGLSTVMPKYTYEQKGSFPEELQLTIDRYDSSGNITQYTPATGVVVSVVWNQEKTLPIAKIENATYASLLSLPGGLSADFRSNLPGARVISFSYKPLIGMSVMVDVNNRPTYYEYDAYGRLQVVKDQNGDIVKTFEYNYRYQ